MVITMGKGILHWFMGKASIRKKLVISFSLLVLIPLTVLGVYSFQVSNENLMRQTEETMDNNLSRISIEMEARIQREEDFIRYLAYNLDFRKTLEENPDQGVTIAQELNKSVEPVLWYFVVSDTNIKQIQIISPVVDYKMGDFLFPARLYEEEDWYQEHKTNYKTTWSVEDGRLYGTRTILDRMTSSEMIGVMRTEFFIGSILEPISSMDYLKNGIILTDEKDRLIYEKTVANDAVRRQVQEQVGRLSMGESITTGDYLLKTRELPLTGWKVYYYIDRDMISGQVKRILTSTLLMEFLCLMAVFFCISIFSRILSRRILILKAQAEKVSGGDLENPYFTTDTDEVGIVINSFATMTTRLNRMINQVYKSELEKKASELKALQAMMNPHFLYNCLSTIKWKALKKGDDEISGVTGLLAKFYRTALNNGQMITTVESELDNIRAYVEIERITHDNRFEVEYRISKECLDCEMLNFLLQPIVENAIIHGIDYKEDEESAGKIIIEFYPEGDYLYFQIYNNGPRLNLEELNRILHTPGKGYAIYNIQERIDLYYGGDCGLSAKITEEQFTCFTVQILKKVSVF